MMTEGFRTIKLLIKPPLNQPDLAASGHYEFPVEAGKRVWSPSVSFESETIWQISADLHEKMSPTGPPGSDPAALMGQGAAENMQAVIVKRSNDSLSSADLQV